MIKVNFIKIIFATNYIVLPSIGQTSRIDNNNISEEGTKTKLFN